MCLLTLELLVVPPKEGARLHFILLQTTEVPEAKMTSPEPSALCPRLSHTKFCLCNLLAMLNRR